MKFFIRILCIYSVIILSSCSTVQNRLPAEADNPLFDAVFSIPKGTIESEISFENNVRNELAAQQERIGKASFELIEVKTMPNTNAYKIELGLTKRSVLNHDVSLLHYKIFYTSSAFNDPIASYHLLDFLSHMSASKELLSPYSTFELYHNAKLGDPIALDLFYKIQTSENHYIDDQASTFFQDESYKNTKKRLEELRTQLAPKIKELKANRSTKKNERKAGLDILDKLPADQQFRTLVSKGDRVGAAELIKKYLPWEEMAPFEKQFWETYLAVVVNPVPLKERVLIYRGLDGDYVHRAYVAGHELSEKEAILQNKVFFMSTVLTKNQGTWNRRLRSLEAMNKKYIGEIDESSENSQAARISTMFLKHSGKAEGSPFLSFTPQMSVAESFGDERVSGFLIDPRLLNFNYTSAFEEEIEYLVPLTTFPDEIVGIVDKKLHPDEFVPNHMEEALDRRLEKLIANTYGENQKEEIVKKIKKNTYDFFKGETVLVNPDLPSVGKSNINFYKNFLTKNDPRPTLSPEGELGCKNLIQLFWVNE